VGHVLENSDPVHKISIVSRGQALGYTMQMPEEDHFLETRDGMLDQIAVLLAGRTAEELFCDDITTGASNDLERATKLAREMVTRYGMSEELGTQVFGEAQHEVFLGRDYANHHDYVRRDRQAHRRRGRAHHARGARSAPARSWRPATADGDHGERPAPARDGRGRGRERAARRHVGRVPGQAPREGRGAR
jgi:cell division protease FtsH